MRYRTRPDGEVEWGDRPETPSERPKTILPPPMKTPNGELLSNISGMRARVDALFKRAKGDSERPGDTDAA